MSQFFYPENLQSKRLNTREISLEDLDCWTEYLSDLDCIKYYPIAPFNSAKERAKFWIERQMDRYKNKQFGLLALLDKNTNAFIGQCGLLTQDVEGIQEIEVGYHVLKKYWGNGYAPEAAKMFMDFGFESNQTDSIISIINTENTKSISVAKKNGLHLDKQIVWKELDVFIYRKHKK